MANEKNEETQKAGAQAASTEQNTQQGSDQTPPPVTQQIAAERTDEQSRAASRKAETRKREPRDIGISYEEDVNNMKAELDKQERVWFHLPLSPGEPKGSTEIVQINGFKMTLTKGQMVHVPWQVAQILSEHYGMESPIENQFNLEHNPDVDENLR